MKIKITGCSVPGIWYEKRIGQTFDVVCRRWGKMKRDGYLDGYFANGNIILGIKACDCELVKDEVITHQERPALVRYHRELITVYSNKQHDT